MCGILFQKIIWGLVSKEILNLTESLSTGRQGFYDLNPLSAFLVEYMGHVNSQPNQHELLSIVFFKYLILVSHAGAQFYKEIYQFHVTVLYCFLLRYIFFKSGGSILTRINYIGEDLKKFNMKDGQSMVYIDYVNQELYYYRKSNTSINICFLDYEGVLLKNILFLEGNVSALTVFGDFIFLQKVGTRVIQEMNVSTGVAYRNISLPKPFSRLNDIVIVDQSQYPTGKMNQHACVTFINKKI